MLESVSYSPAERGWLIALALLGLVGLNGAFVYGVLHPELISGALENPVSLVFVLEALLLTAYFAWLLRKWRVTTLPPWMVIALALLGSLALALPVAVLWRARKEVLRSAHE